MIESGQRPATPEIAEAIAMILSTPQGRIFSPLSFTVRQFDTPVPAPPTQAADSDEIDLEVSPIGITCVMRIKSSNPQTVTKREGER